MSNQVKNYIYIVILSFVKNFTQYIKIDQKLYLEYFTNNKLVKYINDFEFSSSKKYTCFFGRVSSEKRD